MGAADTLDLVGGNGNANAGSTDDDTLLACAGGHQPGHLFAINGIVHAFGGEAAHILKVDVVLLQPDENVLLQQIAAVIAANGNFHDAMLLSGGSQGLKPRLALFKCGKIAEAAFPQQLLALPDEAAHVPGPVGVTAQGDDLAPQAAVQP